MRQKSRVEEGRSFLEDRHARRTVEAVYLRDAAGFLADAGPAGTATINGGNGAGRRRWGTRWRDHGAIVKKICYGRRWKRSSIWAIRWCGWLARSIGGFWIDALPWVAPLPSHRHCRKRTPDAARSALRCRNWRAAMTSAYPPCAARPAPRERISGLAAHFWQTPRRQRRA
jgi:hypothetical protein